MWPSSLPRHGHDGGEKNTSAGLAGSWGARTLHSPPPTMALRARCARYALACRRPRHSPAGRCGPSCPRCLPAAAALATKGRAVALPVALPADAAAAALALPACRCGTCQCQPGHWSPQPSPVLALPAGDAPAAALAGACAGRRSYVVLGDGIAYSIPRVLYIYTFSI